MQLFSYCIAAFLAASAVVAPAFPSGATQPAASQQPAAGEADFTIFINGSPIGRERVTVAQNAGGWTISSTGRYGAPLNIVIERFEIKYTADWHPVEMRVEAMQGTRPLKVLTSFGGTTAINEITQGTTTSAKTDQISARAVVLIANGFHAAYEALAARLADARPGTEVPVYVAAQTEIRAVVKGVTEEQLQGPGGPIATRRYDVTFQNPAGPLDAQVTIDARGRLLRLETPAAGLAVVRSDLAVMGTRAQPVRNPTDANVTIPSAGFSLAGTITTPPKPGRLKHPAVVLVAGSGRTDRDETLSGIPIFAQLAGALADDGYIVLRYDKRGVGQSGGRPEQATIQTYADDLIAAVKWLAGRDDVDSRRIAVAGHSEGGWVALLAASREKRISSLILMAAAATTGAELILEQQRHVFNALQTPEAERQEKTALQKRIHNAVITDRWEGVPEEFRRQADSAWFRSLLLFDPAKVMAKVKKPILILHGSLDTQVPAHHADKLQAMAAARKKSPGEAMAVVPGINHLLVPASTGEVSEYASLGGRAISPEIPRRIVEWLKK